MADTLLAESGDLADTTAGWRSYGEYLAVLAEEMPAKREEKFGAMSRGWALGTKKFRHELVRDLRRRGAELERAAHRGASEGEHQGLRDDIWEEQLVTLAQAAKIDLERLGARKSDAQKVLLAAAMKASTDVSNGWLTARLVMGTPASASQFVRRFYLRGGEKSAAFKRLLSRSAT